MYTLSNRFKITISSQSRGVRFLDDIFAQYRNFAAKNLKTVE